MKTTLLNTQTWSGLVFVMLALVQIDCAFPCHHNVKWIVWLCTLVSQVPFSGMVHHRMPSTHIIVVGTFGTFANPPMCP